MIELYPEGFSQIQGDRFHDKWIVVHRVRTAAGFQPEGTAIMKVTPKIVCILN